LEREGFMRGRFALSIKGEWQEIGMKLVGHRSSINLRWWEEIEIMGPLEIPGGRKLGFTKDNGAGADLKVGQ
jgi:hypothetical protein